MGLRVCKKGKKIWRIAEFKPATLGFWTTVTPSFFINPGTNGCARKSARHGQIQDKEQKKRRLLNWKFSFRIFYPAENNKSGVKIGGPKKSATP